MNADSDDLYCWGSNEAGQLGVGTDEISMVTQPVAVALTSVTQLSGRTYNVFARAMSSS